MKPEWILPDIDQKEIELISRKTGVEKKIISILFARGIRNENEIIRFIYPELVYLHSPFLLDGIYNAVLRLRKAVSSKEKIAIFGDSDLDGITSLTLVYSLLKRYGSIPVIRYPKAKESYGLTSEIIDEFIKEKVTLVITVDSGIRDIDEVNYAKENGIDFIITDHHEPDTLLPDAEIINPKKNSCTYPYKNLAGVGVAFKFIHAFLYSYTSGFDKKFILIYKNGLVYKFRFIKNGIIEKEIVTGKEDVVPVITNEISSEDFIVLLNSESLTLASIIKSMHKGISISDIKTISSSVLKKEYSDYSNFLRNIFNDLKIDEKYECDDFEKYSKIFMSLQWTGSEKINAILKEFFVLVSVGTIADIMPLDGENRLLVKLGLSAINERSGHKGILFLTGKSKSTSKSISWDIAPLLNAPGRMGETGLTVDFFLEDDDVKLSETVNSIRDINDERKRIVAEIIEKIKNSGSADIINENLFFYMDNQIIDGLAGLIANRIADDFKKPVIIATGTGENGLVKGSGRSYGGFDFFKHTSGAAHLFERVGGHAQAFGFTAKENNVIEIIDIINNSLKEAYITENSVSIDLQLEIDDVNTAFINILHLLEPFGKCNEEPLFLIKDLSLDGFSSFGNQGTHGKYILAGNIQAIGWNMFEKMNQFYSQKKNIDLLFKLENNEYMGKTYPRIIIVDIDYSEK